ncbi:MAG: pseudouridine synthase [Candidatus Binatia bacterium]
MNQGYRYSNQVDGDAAGESVLGFYTQRYAHSTQAQWLDRIVRGAVRLDGQCVASDVRLRAGQILTYERAPWTEPDTPTTFAVLYADEQIIAVDKPAGLPVLPGGERLERTLLALVRARFDGDVPPSPVHRIGRGTSGIVLFAKTRDALRALTAAFAARRVTKLYRALVEGVGLPPQQQVDVPVGRVSYPPTGYLYAALAGGAPSRSAFRLLCEDRVHSRSLLEVRIVTGRAQQIRIHAAAIGHPLVGDPLYVAGGGPAPLVAGTRAPLPGDCGYHLHATQLTFRHPASRQAVEIVCHPPPRLRRPDEGETRGSPAA